MRKIWPKALDTAFAEDWQGACGGSDNRQGDRSGSAGQRRADRHRASARSLQQMNSTITMRNMKTRKSKTAIVKDLEPEERTGDQG